MNLVTTVDLWRAGAVGLAPTHPVFDHLGARQLDAETFEVWLVVLTPDGQPARLTTRMAASDQLPTVSDLWAGASWCEREASEGYDLRIGQRELLLLTEESERGVMRRERLLAPRQEPWPGSHEPSGRSRLTPLGRA